MPHGSLPWLVAAFRGPAVGGLPWKVRALLFRFAPVHRRYGERSNYSASAPGPTHESRHDRVLVAGELNLMRFKLDSPLLCGNHSLANDLVTQLGISGNVSHLVNNCGFDFTRWQRRMLARLSSAFDRSDASVVSIYDRVALGDVVNHGDVAIRTSNQAL